MLSQLFLPDDLVGNEWLLTLMVCVLSKNVGKTTLLRCSSSVHIESHTHPNSYSSIYSIDI